MAKWKGGTMIYGFNANEVFKIAIEIEENGRRFYEKVQDVVEESGVNEIFARLALAEVEHKRRFISLKSQLPRSAKEETVWDPDNELDQYLKMMADMHVFKTSAAVDDVLAGVRTAQDALHLAIQFEKDSIVFFLTMQEAAKEEEGRKLIGQLVEEEKEHLRTLSRELRRLYG
jgi:rubrerythrin